MPIQSCGSLSEKDAKLIGNKAIIRILINI
jgi:hypothetical protein